MNVPQILARLQDERGLKQYEIAEALNISQPTISRWNQGVEPRGQHRDALRELAIKHGLLDEVRAPSRNSIVSVMGRIGAGAEIDAGVEQVPPEGYYDIETTLSLPLGSIGFEVVGDSMYPRYYAGDVIICHRDGTPFRDIPNGTEAALLTGDGRRFVKQMFKTEAQNFYDLVSYNAPVMRSVPVAWAALILVIIPASQWSRVSDFERSKLHREAAKMKQRE